MNLNTTARKARAISAITWAVESTGRLFGKGGRAFYHAIKHRDYYNIDVMIDGAIVDTKKDQTKDNIKSLLSSLDNFNHIQLVISSNKRND